MYALPDAPKNVGIPGETLGALVLAACVFGELEDWTGCAANLSSSWLPVPGLFAAIEDALCEMM